jgi:hypothetical protein
LSELAAAQLVKLTGGTVELKSSPLRPGAVRPFLKRGQIIAAWLFIMRY